MDARAANITWTIQESTSSDSNVTFGGTFDYDADTNTYSNINLHVGSAHPNSFYSGFSSELHTRAGNKTLGQAFDDQLTNAGGTTADVWLYGSSSGYTSISSPGVSSGAPEPGSILLGGSGMLGFALLQLCRRLAK